MIHTKLSQTVFVIFIAIVLWAMLCILILGLSYSERFGQSMPALLVCHFLFFISTTWQVFQAVFSRAHLFCMPSSELIKSFIIWCIYTKNHFIKSNEKHLNKLLVTHISSWVAVREFVHITGHVTNYWSTEKKGSLLYAAS